MIRVIVRTATADHEVREFRQTSVKIGRRPANDLAIDDNNVSGFHGEIRTSRNGLVFEDLGSTNGSFVRRHQQLLRVAQENDQMILLRPGDRLLIGEPTTPVVLEPEFVADSDNESQEFDTNIELAQTLDAADSQIMRSLSASFDQTALLGLHQFTEQILSIHELDAMLAQFAKSVLDLFSQAERISVFLQGDGEEYFPVLSRNRAGDCPYEKASRTLKKVVLESGQAVLFAASDRELLNADSLRKSNISVGLCAPLRDGKRTFGFAQMDSREKLVPFNERDLQVFAVFSRQLALSVSNVQLNQDLNETVKDLELTQQKMEKLAFQDPLTGLANRRLLKDRLEQAMKMRHRKGSQSAVLYVDLDNFKRINDSLGHDAGDELLCVVAKRLSRCVRAPDTVGRLGGDEFALLLPEVKGAEGAQFVAEKVLTALREPVSLGSDRIIVTTSIGITLAPADASDAEGLLRNADIALYRAKSQGRDNAQFFSNEMKHDAAERLSLEGELRHALERDELRLYYQPIWRLGDDRPWAAEALVRWQHPSRGLLLPETFIGLAEETGLVAQLGEWVLRETCEELQRIRALGLGPFRLSVNLSPRQLLRGTFIESWQRILAQSGCDASQLQVEITETTLMENLSEARRVLDHLRDLGMTVAIDDFGTGYSSLGYLKELPIDTLKIDQRFVQGIEHTSSDGEIAAAIIAMAHKLGLSVVAEGIETVGQLAFLRANDCDHGQGFYLARPQEFDDTWIRKPTVKP